MHTTIASSPPSSTTRRDDRSVRFAWACLATFPLVVVIAFVGGSLVATSMGVEEGAAAGPLVAVVVMLGVSALLALPVGLAWWLSDRALSHGDTRARVPAIVVTVLAVAFVLVNVGSWLLTLIGS